MKIIFMGADIDNFRINGSEFDFENKNIEEVWLNKEFLIRAEKLSESEYSEYKISFLKSIEGSEIEVEYEDELEIEIRCVKCGRKMEHLITKYPLSDFLIKCYTERFYNCLKVEGGCGYEVIIGVDECEK